MISQDSQHGRNEPSALEQVLESVVLVKLVKDAAAAFGHVWKEAAGAVDEVLDRGVVGRRQVPPAGNGTLSVTPNGPVRQA